MRQAPMCQKPDRQGGLSGWEPLLTRGLHTLLQKREQG
jgi:hypothetical protein